MDYLDLFYSRVAELRMQKGVSARDMSLSLGQSESYINKIENKRTLPSMTGFFYICEYFGVTPQEFFNYRSVAPQKTKELIHEIEKLSPEQADHILLIIGDILKK
ncbi:MAG: helix-turn-helix domain-containing protein [Candidatus Heteroscillospira sp.]|jgi:transcriptional regulator with XRE-family HTH domain